MILALTKRIDNLHSPDQFNLSQESSGQHSSLLVYAYAGGIELCEPCVRPLSLLACCTTYANLSLPPSTIPFAYFCDKCIWPIFHTCQSPTLLNCFGQVRYILGNKKALIFPL